MYPPRHIMAANRRRFQYCRVIILTSLVWFMFDVFLLMYFTDCASNRVSEDCADNSKRQGPPNTKDMIGVASSEKPLVGLFDRFIPNVFRSKPVGPGEMGKAVVIPKDKEIEMKELFKINQFNLMASDLVSVNRSLPDYRLDSCRSKTFPEDLPDTSVVIVFHNEAWSTLMRTVWSIVNRSPRKLVREVILVDDASDKDFLGKPLEDYLPKFPLPVSLVRMGTRSGLIRARLKGAALAQGKVITFLDAHCECTEGWLEPLLFEIYKNRKSVVCPIIDVISDDTFEYITGSDMTWGGFNWKLNFRWYTVPQRELDRRGGDRSLPLRSPTMAGGLFSIDKDYFNEIGSYDSGMVIWGGENLEMSFRVWMCGGQILIATCSRVGHVFRKVSPYSWPGGVVQILNHNTLRTAEVWMDAHKEFLFKINPSVKQTNYGNVTDRLQLREKLQCKSFIWYLENIYPESLMPARYFALGSVMNKETKYCLDGMGRKAGEKVGLINCHNMGGNQVFAYSKKKELMIDEFCLDTSYRGYVLLQRCHGIGGSQEWYYDKKTFTLRHVQSNQCLDKASLKERDTPNLATCSGALSQQWILQDFDEKNYNL